MDNDDAQRFEPVVKVRCWRELGSVEVWSFHNWMRPSASCGASLGLSTRAHSSVRFIEGHAGRQHYEDHGSGVLVHPPGESVVVKRLSGTAFAPGQRTIVGIVVPEEMARELGHERMRPGMARGVVQGRDLASHMLRTIALLEDPSASRCRAEEALLALFSAVGKSVRPAGPVAGKAIKRSRDYIHANLARPFSLSEMAGEIGVSRWHLARQFREHIGMSPGEYARALRAKQALDLLRAGQLPARIVERLGFCDQPHLTREVRSFFGVTPARFYRAIAPIALPIAQEASL